MKIMRLLFAVALLAAAFGIRADQNEKPPKGHGKYLIVLWEPGTPVPGKPEERMKRFPELDIDKLGGRLLSKHANRRVVFLPYGVAKQLRKHEGVSIVQRIWMGEPFSEWNETNATLTELRAADVSTNEDPTFTWERSYSYDPAGNITDIGNDAFAYDDLDRLTQASVDGSSQTYSYDAFGNLTEIGTDGVNISIPVHPSSNRITGQMYDVAGNLVSRSHAEYDAYGNVVRRGQGSYAYDSLNMLVEYVDLPGHPSTARRIVYDADDERIGLLGGQALDKWTIRGLDGQILREFTGYLDTWGWEQDHIRGEGQLIAGDSVVWGSPYGGSQLQWGGKRHYHLDHLGSVRVVTNEDGKALSQNDFYPFGAARTKQKQEQINWSSSLHLDGMRFAGHWRAFLGHPGLETEEYLDYMHARYYDPNLGRFLSVDPLLDVKRSTREPQSWNRYSYVINNPINRIDPDGRMDGNGMGEPMEWACGGCTRDEQLEQSNQIAKGTAIGGAVSLAVAFGGPPAWKAAGQFLFRHLGATMLAATILGGGADRTLQQAARAGGPTLQVITNQTGAPALGRGLSTAVGDNAQAVANAFRSGPGVKTFVANIPQALIKGLDKAGLVRIIQVKTKDGVSGVEYRFAPGASQYIVDFFKEKK